MILSRLRTRIEKNLLIILTVQVNVKRIMVKKQKKKKIELSIIESTG